MDLFVRDKLYVHIKIDDGAEIIIVLLHRLRRKQISTKFSRNNLINIKILVLLCIKSGNCNSKEKLVEEISYCLLLA